MEYVGPPDDPHAHERKFIDCFLYSFLYFCAYSSMTGANVLLPLKHIANPESDHDDAHKYEEPKTFADFVKPEYRWN